MRCQFRTTVLAVTASSILWLSAATGCQSGWKFPGADYLSFNKKPSAESLAAKGPSSVSPASPASQNEPKLVAGDKNRKAVSPAGTFPETNPAIAAGPSVQTSDAYAAGAAANANGFSTGRYNTATPPADAYAAAQSAYNATAQAYGNAAVAATATTPSQATYPAGSPAPSYGHPSGYSQPATMAAASPAATANPHLPTAAGYNPPTGQVNAQTVGYTGVGADRYAAAAATTRASYGPSGYPNVPTTGAAGTTAYTPTGGFNVPAAGDSVAASPAGYAVPAAATPTAASPSAYAAAPQMGVATSPAATVATQAAAPAATTSVAGYRPGSTQRTTGYDFGVQPATASISSGAAANTATSTSNPGYSLPPAGLTR